MISREVTPSKPESFLTKRRLAVAGIAAFIGCAACCAIPLLAVAGLGGGAAAALSAYLRPGSELIIGIVVFGGALAVMAVRARLKPGTAGCGPACKADGSCCDRGARVASVRSP
jgi:mercuric ion transport protein